MISSISVKNYKAFKEATLNIKPLTVLLGANSVGKSSILQLLLLLKQTATFGAQSDKVPVKMYGPFANMGTIDNLFHNKNGKSVLEVSVSFRNDRLQSDLNRLFSDFTRTISTIPYLFPIKGLLDIRLSEKQMPKGRKEFYLHTKEIFEVLEKTRMTDFRTTLAYLLSTNSCISANDITTSSIDAVMATYDFLSALKSMGPKRDPVVYTVSFSFCQKNKKLITCGIKYFSNDKEVFQIDMLDGFQVTSKFCVFSAADQHIIEKSINRSTCIFSCFQDRKNIEEQETTPSNYLLKCATMALNALKSEFHPNVINHVKPLRANPQRYYVIDDEKLTPYASSLDGDRVIEILRDNDSIKQAVNLWLSRYNLAIDIEQSEDVIHHIKIIQNDVELDIPDVGFGISQLLPILVQAHHSHKNTLTIIEQPEIHLHPIMQADMADLFKDAASADKPFIIETHSEYLLRRIRRRVAKGDFSSNDVAIYLFKGRSGERDYTEVEYLDMTDTGSFEWPSDFYSGELYNDIVEYITAQSK